MGSKQPLQTATQTYLHRAPREAAEDPCQQPRYKLGEQTGSEAQRTLNERGEQSCCAVPTAAFVSASCLVLVSLMYELMKDYEEPNPKGRRTTRSSVLGSWLSVNARESSSTVDRCPYYLRR